MDDAGFGGFIESRTDGAISGCGVFLLAALKEGEIVLFERFKARLDAGVLSVLPRAVAHPTFG